MVHDLFDARNLAHELAGVCHQRAVDRRAGQYDFASIDRGFDAGDAHYDGKAFAKLDTNMRFQGLVIEDSARGFGFTELGALDEIANELHTGLDRIAIGVQHQIVEQGILPIDSIHGMQAALMRSVVAFDFEPRGAPVREAGSLHHRLLADFHGGTDADARHVRNLSQNDTRSPAADQDVSLFRDLEDFLGRVARQALATDLPTLAQRGTAFEKVMDGTIRHVHVLG